MRYVVYTFDYEYLGYFKTLEEARQAIKETKKLRENSEKQYIIEKED